jgi:tRNA pseudouridine38-40 synthase
MCRGRDAPMPACMRSARSPMSNWPRAGTPTRCATRSTSICGRTRSRCAPAADDFDARFSALQRHYLYRIVNRRADLAIDAGRALRVPRPLDAAVMHDAAQHLVGRHDFTTFRAAECQAKSPVKTLDRLDVERHGEELRIHASARSFLHHQVRSMVGSLVQVGEGRWSADDLARALAARDRRACGPVAPPDGLYLVRVDYPPGT